MKGDNLIKKADEILDNLYKSKDNLEKINLYKQYITIIRKSAYQGNAKAQYELAQSYEDISVFGINPNCDFVKARYWYGKSCEQNFAPACNNLASLYNNGLGGERDSDMATMLYKKAMELGDDLGKKNYKKQLKSLKPIK